MHAPVAQLETKLMSLQSLHPGRRSDDYIILFDNLQTWTFLVIIHVFYAINDVLTPLHLCIISLLCGGSR